jgi:hypothetical protein
MSLVFLEPSTASSAGSSNLVAKSHAAKLGAEKRRRAKLQQALDCLGGGPLPANRHLVIRLSRRGKHASSRLDSKRQSNNSFRPAQEMEPPDTQSTFCPSPMTSLTKGNSDPSILL